MPDAVPDRETIASEILRLTGERGPDKSICPSEVARGLAAPDAWRRLMGPVRDEAARLAGRGEIEILRKGRPVPPGEMRGVIRLRIRPR